MSPPAAESTVAESTATETMLDAKSTTMESAAVIAAGMVRTAIAVRAAVVTVINAASQNDDSGHRKKRVERPLLFAELRRWFARFRDGLFVDKFGMFHIL